MRTSLDEDWRRGKSGEQEAGVTPRLGHVCSVAEAASF